MFLGMDYINQRLYNLRPNNHVTFEHKSIYNPKLKNTELEIFKESAIDKLGRKSLELLREIIEKDLCLNDKIPLLMPLLSDINFEYKMITTATSIKDLRNYKVKISHHG